MRDYLSDHTQPRYVPKKNAPALISYSGLQTPNKSQKGQVTFSGDCNSSDDFAVMVEPK